MVVVVPGAARIALKCCGAFDGSHSGQLYEVHPLDICYLARKIRYEIYLSVQSPSWVMSLYLRFVLLL